MLYTGSILCFCNVAKINLFFSFIVYGIIILVTTVLGCLQIKGLPEAFESDPAVCSNYHTDYVQKTYPAIEKLEGGNAIFTFPNTPIKCAGAPQKICYITDDYLRRVSCFILYM